MSLNVLNSADVIEAMENFLSRRRPPENMRQELDIGYKIERQSVLIFEIRPDWENPETKKEFPIAKATFVKSKNHWNVYWIRDNKKWNCYPLVPDVKSIEEFTKVVEEDKYHCFWG